MSQDGLFAKVQELLHAYVECIDEDRLEDWPKFFAQDCLYQIIPREITTAGCRPA
jgi:anthranilate 1,2-dioxygenase small subunit